MWAYIKCVLKVETGYYHVYGAVPTPISPRFSNTLYRLGT